MNLTVPFDNISVVNIEPTNLCNLHCIHCGDDKVRPIGFMTPELCDKLASQCKGKEIRLFMSGEPLLHPEIDDLIKIARKYSDKIVIHTNATTLTGGMSERLIEAGLTTLSISFDGLTKQEYESVRFGANFEQVSENIKSWIRINKGRVHTTLQRIIEQGYPQYDLRVLFPGANSYPVIVRHSWSVRDKIKGHRSESIYEEQCYFLWNYMSVLWDGRVNTCCADLNGKCIIGDATKTLLCNIWNEEKLKSIRQRMLNRELIPEICSGCERYKF